jgi:hypothetical protein
VVQKFLIFSKKKLLCIRNIVFSCHMTLILVSLFLLFYFKGTGSRDRIQVFLQKWIVLGLIKVLKRSRELFLCIAIQVLASATTVQPSAPPVLPSAPLVLPRAPPILPIALHQSYTIHCRPTKCNTSFLNCNSSPPTK